MKIVVANEVRTKYLDLITKALADEDVGMIASNAINFPIVTEEGEEGWVEITVKIPKSKDEGDEGYSKREEYQMKCAERDAKAKEKAEAKARKIARDKANREARKVAKEKGE
jgi:hypothetical protein